MDTSPPPRVSVVMAACNRRRFLGPAIDSVLRQTLDDLELIIADDGSDPVTRAMLRAAQRDRRVRVLWRAHCGSPAKVRNAALREARGRYVAFQDSDDLWEKDKLASQLAALAQAPGARWCYCACVHIDADGREVMPENVLPWRAHAGAIRDALACLRVHAALPTVLVERELLERAGHFDEGLRYFEDHDLWLRFADLAEVAVVARPLVRVRRHDQHYSGHEPLMTAECRAQFLERAWRMPVSAAARGELRRIRALHAAHLARLRARGGDRTAARESLRGSLHLGWRYARWWLDAAHVYIGDTLVRRRPAERA